VSYTWQEPIDFQAKTRLYADDLDVLANDLRYLRQQLNVIWPVGIMLLWPADPPAPANWVICDGQVYANGSFPALAAVLGNRWGGTPGASFAVPDMRGRAPIGVGQGVPNLTQRALGTLLGVETVTLAVAQMPLHAHTANDHSHSGTTNDQDRNHQHWANLPEVGNHRHGTEDGDTGFRFVISHGGGVDRLSASGTGGTGTPVTVSRMNEVGGHGHDGWVDAANTGHLHGFGTGGASNRGMDNQGGNAAHDNMQPSSVTNFIIRAA